MPTYEITDFIPKATWDFVKPHISDFAIEKLNILVNFVENECIPAESTFHGQISDDPATRWAKYPQVIEDLKVRARELGLWNLFLSKEHYPEEGQPLTNLEYSIMAEIMGRSIRLAPEACNCSAPDTGNMEVLARFGTPEQKKKWLKPILEGRARSAFAMTERKVASSDATNIETSIRQEGDEIVINGHKWWISGAGDPRTILHLVMGKSDTTAEKHGQQSIVIVPSNTPGVKLIRPMKVFGFDDAPEGHFELIYDNVRVPLANLVAGWGRGFEIIQARLGPGRIHHCMRSIGVGSRAIDIMIGRITDKSRRTFGQYLYEHETIIEKLAKSRVELDQARMLVLQAALQIDKYRAKGAMLEIGMAKASVPTVVGEIIDRAMQVHGAGGLSQATPLAPLWVLTRTLRIADGPDEVHYRQVGLRELKRADAVNKRAEIAKEEELRLLSKNNIKHVL